MIEAFGFLCYTEEKGGGTEWHGEGVLCHRFTDLKMMSGK